MFPANDDCYRHVPAPLITGRSGNFCSLTHLMRARALFLSVVTVEVNALRVRGSSGDSWRWKPSFLPSLPPSFLPSALIRQFSSLPPSSGAHRADACSLRRSEEEERSSSAQLRPRGSARRRPAVEQGRGGAAADSADSAATPPPVTACNSACVACRDSRSHARLVQGRPNPKMSDP